MTLDTPSEATPGERSDSSEDDAETPATILVVDDEPYARQLLTDLLEAQGFRVVAVARGEEAFSWLGVIDLVLLDAMLPGRDGWSICREIRSRHDPLLPIIMVTARTAPDDVVRTFEAGADDYIAKPFHAAELTARIGSRLRVHRAERKLQKMNRQLADLAEQNYKLYEQARSDAEERALLLREIDHRVRNNLSVIMGLVSMERNRRPPRPANQALLSLENRLRSFLLVHESLRRQNYRAVPVREITERMAQRLRNTMDVDGRIRLQFTGESAALGERQGFALALALNELITNALRHAFPEGRAGTIRIHVADHNGDVRLEVSDDGIGVHAAAANSDSEVVGSGRSIVDALVRGDLGGRVDYLGADQGTRVVLTFPREHCTPVSSEQDSARSPTRGPERYNPPTPAP
ncbi:MAG TPA: response regulator [Longimicrobiales bacterium]